MPKFKPKVNVVMIGHHKSGKSTTTGHMLYACKGINQESLSRFEQDCKDATFDNDPESYKYAWICDTLKLERERKTSVNVSRWHFETDNFEFLIADAPGCRNFLKNMISGVSQADIGVLMVSAADGEFEAGFAEKKGQTREHTLLAYTLGIKQMIVCVNKMDKVQFAEERYNMIREKVAEYFRRVGYKPAKTPIIPTSGFHGDNLITLSSENMPWWNGPTLRQALDKIQTPKRNLEKLLRIPLVSSRQPKDSNGNKMERTLCTGKILTGLIKPGITVLFAPTEESSTVSKVWQKSTGQEEKEVEEAKAGEVATLQFDTPLNLKRGVVVMDSSSGPEAVKRVESFDAQFIMLEFPGQIRTGFSTTMAIHTAHVGVQIKEIKAVVDRTTGTVIEENPLFIKSGDVAVATFVPSKPLAVELYSIYSHLGRFALIQERAPIAAGIIKAIRRRK